MSTATAGQPNRPATLEDLLAMPEDDRYELVDGVLSPKEAARMSHGRAQTRIGRSLGPYDRSPGGPPERPGGWWFASEVLIQFAESQIRRPDVAGWLRERMPEAPTEVPVTVLPDWICEIVSPTHASNDTIAKMNLYHRVQVPHYWLLDPRDESLTVYRWTKEGYLRVLGATRGACVRAAPFEAVELHVGVFFGDDEP